MKHIKKSGIVMVLILVTALCIGCGSKVNEEKSNQSTENHSSQVEEETQKIIKHKIIKILFRFSLSGFLFPLALE